MKTPVYDAYTGVLITNGQLDVYDFAVRDSVTGGRRTITIPSDIANPPRRVVKILDNWFLVGDTIDDAIHEFVLKKHWILHPVDSLGEYGTPAQVIAAAGTTQAYVGVSWRKTQKEETVSANIYNLYNLYCSTTETPEQGHIVLVAGVYYRIAGIERTTGGFKVAIGYDIGSGALTQVTYSTRIYDRVLEQETLTAVTVQAFVERYQTAYEYLHKEMPKFVAGDRVFTVSASDIPAATTGDYVDVGGTSYSILAVQDDGLGSWLLHGRPQ